jgi:hypothetical protein
MEERENQARRLRIAKSVLADITTLHRSAPVKSRAAAALCPEKRGVYHRISVDGSMYFEVIDSDGIVQFELRPAQQHCNQRTYRWLETVLDAIDPPRNRLRAI